MGNQHSLKLVEDKSASEFGYKRLVGELWTARQRQMHSLHYCISYRGSFKPELPDFCIRRYSEKGQVVLDPFTGRGTTALQANLLGRVAWASDANPLAVQLTAAKTGPIGLDEIVLRLHEVDFRRPIDLSGYQEKFAPFYHPDTYRELINLRSFLLKKMDRVNNFIQLIALSRLHGHSTGFFSVYSFPQISIPPESQRMINRKRRQEPDFRAIAPRIIKKAAQALRDGFTSDFFSVSRQNRIKVSDARKLSFVSNDSVDLIVTSPPFLDKVDYLMDNWLEGWFAGVSPQSFSDKLVMCRSLEQWRTFIREVLTEMCRVLKPKGHVVLEVGEVETSSGVVFLDDVVAEEAMKISVQGKRFSVEEVLVNQQNFTKLAHCFQIDNNQKGTNTNRLVVMKVVSPRQPRKLSKP